MPSIQFFSEDLPFSPPHPRKTKSWIKQTIAEEKHHLGDLNFIFCSDEYLLQINVEYLSHQTYTDIITFDNSEDPAVIEGDIFISVERIRENASKFNSPFEEELRRVIIHGVLHLLGYSDKSSDDKIAMRGKEDAYLSLFQRST
jgi:probable rRNA maturation factor